MAQVKQEVELSLPLSAGSKTDAYLEHEVAARQLVFLDGWVRPLFKAASVLFPSVKSRVDQIEVNREACEVDMAKLPPT